MSALALMSTISTSVLAGGIIPDLGTAGSFGVLGASAVTNTGPTIVRGDLGVSPGTAVSGFPPGIVIGSTHAGDSVAAQAQIDATIAYNDAAGQACDSNLTGQDLGGMTLIPGVYLLFRLVSPTHRAAHPGRPGQPQKCLHLPDREYSHHGE